MKKGLTNRFCFDIICERSEERGTLEGRQESRLKKVEKSS